MPVELRMLFQKRHGGGDALRGLVRLQGRDHVAAFVLVAGRAAERRQHIDRERQKAFERDAARDVLDVRIEPAVFVNDDDRRAFRLALEPRQIAFDRRAGGIIGDGVDRQPRILGRDHGGARIIVLQQRQQRHRGGAGTGDLGQPVEKGAAVDAAMREAVVEIDDALIHKCLLTEYVTITNARLLYSLRHCAAAIKPQAGATTYLAVARLLRSVA